MGIDSATGDRPYIALRALFGVSKSLSVLIKVVTQGEQSRKTVCILVYNFGIIVQLVICETD